MNDWVWEHRNLFLLVLMWFSGCGYGYATAALKASAKEWDEHIRKYR